eukprot:TRINITY_DN1408_c0_g1_i2.p1 TRINITY_DN1408_c0_g1~~TRINITY_DN1408_c0_g1_i2.p1  ORF type:complete len:135 (+),score=17.80 TRINITY_DN1408_c0_g1_i2:42-407(+)
MKIFLLVFFVGFEVAFGCIGDGCIHDREENRFFWFSDRAGSEIANVKEQGGPSSYCLSLGLTVTSPGSSIWMRAMEIERRIAETQSRFSFTDDSVEASGESAEDPKILWPIRTVCHEMKWN